MSLADELEAEKPHRPEGPIDRWINDWYATLDEEDKAAWDASLADPTKAPTGMWRVIQRRGYPYSCSGFDKWVRRQRDTR